MPPERFFLRWMPRPFVWKKKLLLVFLASFQLFPLQQQALGVREAASEAALGSLRHLQRAFAKGHSKARGGEDLSIMSKKLASDLHGAWQPMQPIFSSFHVRMLVLLP